MAVAVSEDGLDMETGPEPSSSSQEPRIMKFEVQVYKARDGEYVLDFQVR